MFLLIAAGMAEIPLSLISTTDEILLAMHFFPRVIQYRRAEQALFRFPLCSLLFVSIVADPFLAFLALLLLAVSCCRPVTYSLHILLLRSPFDFLPLAFLRHTHSPPVSASPPFRGPSLSLSLGFE